jgi:3-phytase/alkaline phosphatase D
MRRLLAVLVTCAACLAWAAPAPARGGRLQFLGQAIVPTGTMFQDTTIGGLSSITYDRARGVYYTLSDDPSQFQPARFYTVAVDLSHGSLDGSDVSFRAVTTLRAPDGQPYPPQGIDPEGLTLTCDRRLVLTSEGFSDRLIPPFVRRYALDGTFLSDFEVPAPFLPTADKSAGVRPNLAFESANITPDCRHFFTGTENALYQDGPAATIANGSPSRLMRYDVRSGRLDGQYAYETDPVFQPPVPATQFSVNGLDELLPLDDDDLIGMERSFSVGAPGTGNTIKLYDISLRGATDVNGAFSIAGKPVRFARKRLILNLDDLGIPLDNIEGITVGPRLRDGRPSLVLVSDNNFAASQFTQFLLFAVGEPHRGHRFS